VQTEWGGWRDGLCGAESGWDGDSRRCELEGRWRGGGEATFWVVHRLEGKGRVMGGEGVYDMRGLLLHLPC
jgi:hypothetical protein